MEHRRSIAIVSLLLATLPTSLAAASDPATKRLPYHQYWGAMGLHRHHVEPWRGLETGCSSLVVFSAREDIEEARARAIACRQRAAAAAQHRRDVRREVVALTELALSYADEVEDRHRQWMQRALDLTQELGEACWHTFLVDESARLWSKLTVKREILARAVAGARDGGCGPQLARALYSLAACLPREDPDVTAHLQEALDLGRGLDDPALMVGTVHALARRYADHGDPRAVALRRELISLHQSRGDVDREMEETWNLGVTYDHLDDPLAAMPLLERYLAYLEAEERNADRETEYLEAVRERARGTVP